MKHLTVTLLALAALAWVAFRPQPVPVDLAVVTEGPMRGTVNAGDTETTGIELNMTWQATDNLLFQGNLTSLDAEAATTYEFLNGDVLMPGDPLPNVLGVVPAEGFTAEQTDLLAPGYLHTHI